MRIRPLLCIASSALRAAIFVGCIVATPEISFAQTIIHGTTIAFVRTKDTIYVAADSKERVVSASNPGDETSLVVHKISVAGRIAFAVTGFSQYPATGFKADDILRGTLEAEKTVLRSQNAISKNVTARLRPAWEDAHRKKADDISRVIGVLTCGFERGVAYVVLQTYVHRMSGDSTVIFRPPNIVFPLPGKDDSVYYDFMSKSVKREAVYRLERFIRVNPIEYVRGVVKTAIEVDSLNNGPPIDVLCITRRGLRWISH